MLHFAGSLCHDAVRATGNAAGVPLDGFHIHKTIDLRGQQPAIGLLDAGLYGIVAAVKIGVHLFVLGGVKVQRFLVILNGTPCTEVPDGLPEREHCLLIRCHESQHIAVGAGL